jgi:enoyl-CoA hydratase/carnithine racemase
MPFLGETRPRADAEKAGLPDHLHEAPHGLIGGASALQAAINAARKEAAEHEEHALNRKSTPQKSDRTDLW